MFIKILSSKLTFEVFTSANVKIVGFLDEEPCALAIHLRRNIILPKMGVASFLLDCVSFLSNNTLLQP
jgi:hypothetical protein